MRYLTLISLLCGSAHCFYSPSELKIVSAPGLEQSSDPTSICTSLGMQPFMLMAEDVPSIVNSLKSKGIGRAAVAGWNGEKITMIVGSAAGEVAPLADVNRTNTVLCYGQASAPQPAAPAQPAPSPAQPAQPAPSPAQPTQPAPSPVQPAPQPSGGASCATPCATPCGQYANETNCQSPCALITDGVCPPLCCTPKPCIPRKKCSPCDSPCVTNYPHRKVFVIDEISVFCKPYIRILETKCRPFRREKIYTVSKFLPPTVVIPAIPTVLRNAKLLHCILADARDKFGQCGCVCLFIDLFNNIYIVVDGNYYVVIVPRPFPCFPPWFNPLASPGVLANAGAAFPSIPGAGLLPPFFPPYPRPCMPCPPPCPPKQKTDACGRPCPPRFYYRRISPEAVLRIRRRGLFAVLFSRELDQ